MKSPSRPRAIAALLATAGLSHAQTSQFSIDSDDAIRKTAATVAWDMLQYYSGNESGQVPGILPGPPPAGDYYWWEGGAMWGTLIDYWYLTGDDTYNDITKQAMLFQTGDNDDYMPDNYTASMGNDDQGFWGMAALTAAENGFPDPPDNKPGWLALAQGVWNTQASPDRHDDTCNGGLRWQVPSWNNGYDYKNSIANGIFFNTGARLARYTDNDTYADVAEKTWDWVWGVGYIDPDTYAIYDGGHVEKNCTDINKVEYSYNNAIFTLGAAYMYNHTKSDVWKERVSKLVEYGLGHFFPKDIMVEISCEDYKACTTDMKSFKGYMHRWYATTAMVAPHTADKILPVLEKSAAAAVAQCSGGDLGRQCGFKWAGGTFDGDMGAGQQMDVVAAVSSLLIGQTKGPVSSKTGGTSKGDSKAGTGGDDINKKAKPITTGEKAGAGILTFVVLSAACGMFGWMSLGE